MIGYIKDWFHYMIMAIVIIVVAVPEGLPLAVMISLAFSIGAMLKDDCDVKRLASCEIMGGADNICSDKTGTLTNNRMETVRIWCGHSIDIPPMDGTGASKLKFEDLKISKATADLLSCTIACNVPEKGGPTDKAMVGLIERCDVDLKDVEAAHGCKGDDFIRFPFTSSRKRMSTITKNHGVDGYDRRM